MSLYANAWSQSYLVLAVLCASAVFIAIKTESRLVPGWLAAAGDYSYGLYLIHLSIVFAIYSAKPGWPLGVMVAVTLSAGLAGGLLFGRMEQWLYLKYWRPFARRAEVGRERLSGHTVGELAAIQSDQR